MNKKLKLDYGNLPELEPLNPYDDPNYFITRSFESDEDHDARFLSGELYTDEYFKKVREHALKVDKYDRMLRAWILSELKKCVPLHARRRVFDGIEMP